MPVGIFAAYAGFQLAPSRPGYGKRCSITQSPRRAKRRKPEEAMKPYVGVHVLYTIHMGRPAMPVPARWRLAALEVG